MNASIFHAYFYIFFFYYYWYMCVHVLFFRCCSCFNFNIIFCFSADHRFATIAIIIIFIIRRNKTSNFFTWLIVFLFALILHMLRRKEYWEKKNLPYKTMVQHSARWYTIFCFFFSVHRATVVSSLSPIPKFTRLRTVSINQEPTIEIDIFIKIVIMKTHAHT